MINIITLNAGILDTNELYTNPKEAEKRFKELVKKLEPTISDDDLSASLEEGSHSYDNLNGKEILITHPEIMDNTIKRILSPRLSAARKTIRLALPSLEDDELELLFEQIAEDLLQKGDI